MVAIFLLPGILMTSLITNAISSSLNNYFDRYLGMLVEKKINAGTFEGIIYSIDYFNDKADKKIKW